jgi:predicted Rdx family selenoprotein
VRRELDVPASIERGETGEFTVWSDGELVYSKADTGRFPEPGEVASALRGAP